MSYAERLLVTMAMKLAVQEAAGRLIDDMLNEVVVQGKKTAQLRTSVNGVLVQIEVTHPSAIDE